MIQTLHQALGGETNTICVSSGLKLNSHTIHKMDKSIAALKGWQMTTKYSKKKREIIGKK